MGGWGESGEMMKEIHVKVEGTGRKGNGWIKSMVKNYGCSLMILIRGKLFKRIVTGDPGLPLWNLANYIINQFQESQFRLKSSVWKQEIMIFNTKASGWSWSTVQSFSLSPRKKIRANHMVKKTARTCPSSHQELRFTWRHHINKQTSSGQKALFFIC